MSPEGSILINNEWRQCAQTRPVVNPARLSETVGHVGVCTEADADAALDAAYRAYANWSRTTPEQRAARLREAAQQLQDAVPRLVRLYVRENGKPLREAERDILRSIELLEVVAEDLPKWWSPILFDERQPVWARHRPRGVVSVISPWNSPVLLSIKRLVPAVATGNTVILKPATNCPLTITECVGILASHLPAGVLNLVTGPGDTVGEKLASDPRVSAIAFTGSTETGRRIMQLASTSVKKLFLELGGNDPALVLKDAVLGSDVISRMTTAILRASGQVCIAVKRIYVHHSRHDELVETLSGAFDVMVVGDGLRSATTMGPLNNKAQFDFVSGLLERCFERKLRVLIRGQRLDPAAWDQGYFLLPAIVLGASQDDEIVRCEQFGPVVPILPFSDEDEAIARANDSIYGLRASVWSSDREHAARLADRLQAGAVFFNNHGIFQDLHIDFPGVKQSGFGRESRWAGLDHYVDTYGFAE